MNIVLLKAIIAVKMHFEERRTTQDKFEDTVNVFVENVWLPNEDIALTRKTLYESLEKVVANSRAVTCQLEPSSWGSEEVTERTQLLGNIIHDLNKISEQRHLELNERSQREEDPQNASERIRAHAVRSTSIALHTSKTGDSKDFSVPIDTPS